MSRIIKVSQTQVTVQFDDGKTLDLPLASCQGFFPMPGIEVEVICNGGHYILKEIKNSNDDVVKPFVATNREHVKVSKIAYLLLAFFLGAFGIHRFYAGRVTSGVVYLLCTTVGSILVIPPVIIIILVIVDFVKALLSEADDNGNITI